MSAFLFLGASVFFDSLTKTIDRTCAAQEGITPRHFAKGRDRITLAGSAAVWEGTILNITGQEGVIFLPLGEQESQSVPLGKITCLETPLTSEHRQGNEAYEKGLRFFHENSIGAKTDLDYFKEALQFYKTARDSTEKRIWLRLWLTARIVQCHKALMEQGLAVKEFFMLCQADPYTPWIHSIPLLWTEPVSSKDPLFLQLEQMATPWLSENKRNPTASLLAASILLQDSAGYRAKTLEMLHLLISAPMVKQPALQERISDLSRLASAQIWRLDMHRQIPDQELDARLRMIDLLSDELRFGPIYLIALSLDQSDKTEKALDCYLRLALIYPEQKELARLALIHAVKILKRQNRTDQLKRIQPDLKRWGLSDGG